MRTKRMLDKKILKDRYGIKSVSLNGQCIVDEKDKKLRQYLSTAKHTNGKDKSYYTVQVVDKYYNKQTQLLVHNVVYAWYNDDYDTTMDIDHIDNNSLNNNLLNLQQVSRKENLNKDCSQREQQLKANRIKRAKILSGKYLRITKAQRQRIKRWNRNADCFGYTNNYSYVLEEDWIKYLTFLNDYEKAVAEEVEMTCEKIERPFTLKYKDTEVTIGPILKDYKLFEEE